MTVSGKTAKTGTRIVTRDDAVFFAAGGHTAESLRARAADQQLMTAIAIVAASGDSPEAVRDFTLALADGVAELEAEGTGFQDCWAELGWSREHE